VRKANESFEHVKPESVGNTRQFVVSAQAGSSTILERLGALHSNLDKKDPLVKQLLAKIKELESGGYQFEAADASFELIAQEMLGRFTESFEFKGFRVIEEKRESGTFFRRRPSSSRRMACTSIPRPRATGRSTRSTTRFERRW